MPRYERQAEPSKGNFLSWDAGESKDLVILSEKGAGSYTHWIDNEARDCTGESCVLCTEGVKRSLRWTVQTRCEGEEIPWEMSNRCFFGVEDVAEMMGHLPGLRLRVTRHGSGLKTRYSVLPITGEEKAPETKRDVDWYTAEIKRLCALAGMDPRQELDLFITQVEPDIAKSSLIVRMQAFYKYIDEETKESQKVDEPPPEPMVPLGDEPQDIGRYF